MQTLKAYHRPATLDQALDLLARDGAIVAAVAGGTEVVSKLRALDIDEVVDLQALELNVGDVKKGVATVGATVTLQTLVEHEQLPATVREAARREGPNTLRHAATLGGTIVASDATSELLAALLVHEARVDIIDRNGTNMVALDDLLADRPAMPAHALITHVTFTSRGHSAVARVARTPVDAPIVAAVARRTLDGRVLLALCGVAATPVLVDPADVAGSIDPPGDFRGSAEYRREMAHVLAMRVLEEVA